MNRQIVIRTVINMVEDFFGLHHVSVDVIKDYTLEDSGLWAAVDKLDDSSFIIEVEPFLMEEASEEELVKIISHEMVHIKQFVKDGLDLDTSMFRGEKYPGDSYFFAPWEVEARGYEKAFLNHYNLNWDSYYDAS